MTRPSIIRADTIDLQHQEAPSAQDHRHSWYNQLGGPDAGPIENGNGHSDSQLDPHAHEHEHNDDARDHDDRHHNIHPHPHAHPVAPHQAETLREVAHETAEELLRSPGLRGPANGHGPNPADANQNNPSTLKSQDPNAAAAANMDAYRQHEQDAIVAAHNGVDSSDEEDLGDDRDLDLDDDLMDKISSSPSIEDEDIDFEFVYALHTFVATVEGQANATKGDTMVLLDDSNSYWWLVRVVKDSSIGYLPAEHIETPTERLARLNKHRNIDLSATMLGDQATKQKGAFKNLRKRRKTVAFAEPTYVDYSDIDYSTDEEDIEELFGTQGKTKDQAQAEDMTDDITPVEPLRTSKDRNGQDAQAGEAAEATIKAVSASGNDNAERHDDDDVSDKDEDDTSSVEEILHEKTDGPSRSRNGTVRNTDSFFNDEETKKITLTPNLLRDDSAAAAAPRQSSDSASKESTKGRSSLENKMDRELVPDKDKRKSKDKKPSAIRSFFSRKDKKKADDDDESFGKRSMDIMSDPRESEEHPEDAASPPDKPTRTPSKLQKQQPRMEPSPSNKAAAQRSTAELSSFLNASRNDVSSVPPASMRVVDPETQETREVPSGQQAQPQQQPQVRESQNRSASANTHHSDKSGLAKMMPRRSASAGGDAKPQKTVKAKTRMELDESDISELSDDEPENMQTVPEAVQERSGSKADGRTATPQESQGAAAAGTGESSAQASPSNASNPPALVPDTSSAEGRSPEASPSPELMQAKDNSSSASGNREQWDDGKLRAFFDEGEHIRDLLAVVYDKSDVPAVDNEHPYAGGLFREQNAKLAEITTQLDNLLGDWLARKQRLRGSS